MCWNIFTRKLSFFKISPCTDGQLESKGSLPTRRMPSPCPLVHSCQFLSVLLEVWSLDYLHQNHLGCKFKRQILGLTPDLRIQILLVGVWDSAI